MIPCPSCHRHAHAEESSCPFCGAALITIEAVAVQASTKPGRGLQSLAFGVGLTAMTVMAVGAFTIVGCTGTDNSDSESSGSDYAGPEGPIDESEDDTTDTGDTSGALEPQSEREQEPPRNSKRRPSNANEQ
ncbi:hypothetical protein G6O69_13565 [Pseudenhygromyxa sp. WMMC2535]|uniref:hypothetical protein n=1 Tax=Pseudenhygromyxa sp. WMMC2535 TaxID=2712867 RepID=UPI001553BE6E|nr:hypothetical protein [Pseudenhygromyxa sp. WMMC2535]NVB38864.1 hypothetical protein [Pseudenhygromyxa sp. WMMC2535]